MPETKSGVAKEELEHYVNIYASERDHRMNYYSANSLAAVWGRDPKVGPDVMKATDRFLNKEGGLFMDYYEAERSIKSSSWFKDFVCDLDKEFNRWLQSGFGDNIGSSFNVPPPPNLGSINEQLLALFGGTQYINIVIEELTINSDGTYEGVLNVDIFDMYGVSAEDLEKVKNPSGLTLKQSIANAEAQKGLLGMYVLQNLYGYKPLVNGVGLKVNVSGVIFKKDD